MTTVNEIYSFLCGLAPLEDAMDFDNCGLLIGGNSDVGRVMLTLDITSDAARSAAESGTELVISHHPVIFHPLKRLESGTAAYILAQNNTAAVCMHTNLDRSSSCGVNICLAEAIGLKNIDLDKENCIAYGEIDETCAKDFAMKVKNALFCDGLRFTDCGKILRRAAVSSGAGGSNIFNITGRADVFVTGEIKHHELLFAAEAGISVIDAGHRRTEEIVLQRLHKLLSERFPDVEFFIYAGPNDRIKYL